VAKAAKPAMPNTTYGIDFPWALLLELPVFRRNYRLKMRPEPVEKLAETRDNTVGL
jgi:hypothetical protein